MRSRLTISTVLLLIAAGCNRSIAMPDILHPGSLAYQRWRAEVFDPYPTPYLGQPVEGVRPPQYKTPVPEPADNGPTLFGRFGPPPAKYDTAPIL
jgi:hypothetical protein